MAITIKDIALKAGVSHMTVSRALNGSKLVTDETREKILLLAKQLKYKPNLHAKGLVLNKKFSIAVVFSTLSSKTAPSFLLSCLNGVYQSLTKDYNLVIKDLSQGLEHFNLSRADGVIFVSQQESDDEFIRFALAQCTKLVVVNRKIALPNVVSITVDEISAAEMAVNYLLQRDYRKIACINGPELIQSSIDRLAGYQSALTQANLTSAADFVQDGGFSIAGGFVAMQRLLALEDQPDAVFCANDEMAIGALKAINDAGLKVPSDIGLVGFNDSEICQYTTPSLTTIHKPIEQMAKLGGERLFQLINNMQLTNPVTELVAELVIRDSVR
jgi:LacI family transcriptional regulator